MKAYSGLVAMAATAFVVSGATSRSADVSQPSLADLQKAVSLQTEALKVHGADIRVFVNNKVLDELAKTWAAQTNKTIAYHTTGVAGQVMSSSSGPGPLGCGFYVEVRDAKIAITIPGVTVSPSPTGYTFAANYHADVHVQVAGHVNGTKMPHQNHPWEIPWLSCDHPFGGGIGTNVGVDAHQTSVARGRIALAPEASGTIKYVVSTEGNPQDSVTISTGLPLGLPTLGVPVHYHSPDSILSQGLLPAAFEKRGQLNYQGITRTFDLNVIPVKTNVIPGGVEALANVKLMWLPTTAAAVPSK